MKRLPFILVLSSLLLLAAVGTALAQDPARVGPNVYKCTFENERMRLCEIRFKAGDSMPLHSHPDHLVYVTAPGKLRITADGVPADVDFKTGTTTWIGPGAHSAVNIGNTEVRGLVIELKEPAGDPTQRAIMQMEKEWSQALINRDMAALDRIMAPDWVLVDPGGQHQTRAQAIADLRSGAMKFESMTPLDLEVRVYGDTAVVTGRSRDKSTYKGQDVSGEYRFTDVFVKKPDGRWQAVSTHVTRVMPPM